MFFLQLLAAKTDTADTPDLHHDLPNFWQFLLKGSVSLGVISIDIYMKRQGWKPMTQIGHPTSKTDLLYDHLLVRPTLQTNHSLHTLITYRVTQFLKI